MHVRPVLLTVLASILLPACALLLGLEEWNGGPARADGGGGASSGGPANGSRIVARTWAGDDGARVPIGWRDTQLALDCAPMMALDGRVHCLPLPVAVWSGLYADSACSVRVVDAEECPGAAVTVSEPGCPIRYRAWAAGAAAVPAMLYAVGGGGCSPIANGGSAFVALGGELPASLFVGGTITP